MAVLVRVKLEKRKDVTVRSWRAATKGAFRAVGQFWYDRLLPLRFQRGFRAPWITPRSPEWLKRKRALIRAGVGLPGYEDTPNVFRGNFRDALLEHVEISAYPTRCSIRLRGPSYVIQHPTRLPDKFAEVTRIFESERATLETLVHDQITTAIPRDHWQTVP